MCAHGGSLVFRVEVLLVQVFDGDLEICIVAVLYETTLVILQQEFVDDHCLLLSRVPSLRAFSLCMKHKHRRNVYAILTIREIDQHIQKRTVLTCKMAKWMCACVILCKLKHGNGP